jgi:phosphoribosylanthranilate isomerase
MLTQIYEVSSPEEADAVSAMVIDHIGILVGDGSFPREQSLATAPAIMSAVRTPSKVSALFLSCNLSLIETMVRNLNPTIVHLGASNDLLPPAQVAEFRLTFPKITLMRSVPVFGPESIGIARSYDGIVDFLLLDSHKAGDIQIGALGITHDWNVSREIAETVRTPVILAGGLGPDNVAQAIRAVRPAGVDSKTKTDHTGSHSKDLAKVREFARIAKASFG